MPARSQRWLASVALLGLLAAAVVGAPRAGAIGSSPGPEASGLAVSNGQIDLAALYHDSRDLLYRTPGGAVPAGTSVTLRLRTAHDDATAVHLLLTDMIETATRTVNMAVVAVGIPCGEPDPGAATTSCDFWEITVPTSGLTTLGYRFEVVDGDTTAYYTDDAARDGGPGRATPFDSRYDDVITVYDPAFTAIPWLRDGVVYQIFPDRFANGDPSNDASTSAPRYGWPPDPLARVERRAWTLKPEQPPRGRDYYGGDLAGITQHLADLRDLGVTVLYLNPIFDSASNHGYDTRDYRRIDPRFGTRADWDRLVREADRLGIRIILDGVFNHVSSDSPYFDRYGHFPTVGACESVTSPYRSWFLFRKERNGPCAGPDGPHTMGYISWSGYDSLPVLMKPDPGVRALIYAATDAVARTWLRAGASGWRLDVMFDGSFPAGFWQAFRAAVKATEPDAAIVGELWTKAQSLPFLRGDTADSFMNYRFRNAVTGYLGTIDSKGFPDDGQSDQPPALFASKLLSISEDYPPAATAMALNLLDSHDTERILWSLTPAGPSSKEDPANLAIGKARLRLAALLQATLPGAPTIYYGDEVGVTGASDPDDRRTYPVSGGDRDLRAWYRTVLSARAANPVLREGDLRFLASDSGSRAVVFGRTQPGEVAIVAVNPDRTRTVTLSIPTDRAGVGGTPLRDGVSFVDALAKPPAMVRVLVSAGGHLEVTLPPLSGALFVTSPGQKLDGPAAPAGAAASTAADGATAVSWAPVAGAAAYQVWRSPLAGGGYTLAGTVTGASTTLAAAGPGLATHVVVRAVDALGNVGPASAEVVVAAPAPSPVPSAPAPGSSPGGLSALVVLLALGLAAVVLAAFGVVVLRRRASRG